MLALPSLWLALAADPFLADIPLQGALVDADGAAPSGSRTVQFTITGESGPIWSGVKVVHLDRGLFSAMLEGVDLTRLGAAELSITVSLDGQVSAPAPIGWAPRAGLAYDALHVGGVPADEVMKQGDPVPWGDVTGAPAVLTPSVAAATYLTQANATSTYLTQASATSTYLTQANATSTYLTAATAAATYAPLSGGGFASAAQGAAADAALPRSGGTVTGAVTFPGGVWTSGGTVGVGTSSPAATLDVGGTGAIKVPVGTTAQRPAGVAGMVRFNASLGRLEYHNGSDWVGVGEFSAIGGTVTDIPGFRVHTFTASGTFSATGATGDVEVLLVGGGGGGGGSTAGGGGAGGVLYVPVYSVTPGEVTVTVGAGGAGSRFSDAGTVNNTSGGNSVFGALTAFGGGYGASGRPSGSRAAAGGGSGGGGGYYVGNDIPTLAAAAGTVGQGFAGGAAVSSATTPGGYGGGGGGGAGGAGQAFGAAGSGVGGNGGAGVTSSISGTARVYGGGGGGSGNSGGGAGGSGGGGAGGNTGDGSPGTANTGGGGGASGTYQSGSGAAGGSGIVIVRYPH
jgi:hypothetical protein